MELLTHLQKGLASVALTSVAFFGMANAASLGFTDDAEIPSWADEAVEELMDQGVMAGNDDGSFAPNRQLNRAEVSKVIVLATGIDTDTTGGPHFPDVAEDAWYYDYIETMYNQGWINGYPDGQFRPGVGINRAEIAKMVVNGFELDQDLSGAPHFDDVTSGDWFYGYVETIYNNGGMRGYGDGTFGPGNAVTRAETAKIVYDSQLVALGGFNGIAEGTLEVALSNDTPRGTNIPFNATSVPFTTVELTASDDSDVEISSMTFTRLGLGDNDDFENVWLEIDGFKVGNDKSVNNDDVVELRFNPPIVIPAGQTIVADIVASMKFTATDTNTGHHNRFVLVSADDLVSSAANVAGDFPVEGEEMEIANYEVTSVEFDELGSDTTVEVGDSFIEIGKFRIENQSTTNKDVEVRAITFKNDGTAELEDVLENVGLYVSGEQVSAETIIDGDYMTFRLDNGVTGGYIIEDGDSKIFSIRADIVSAERGDTIQFKIDNFEDVVAVEIGTAFGVRAQDPNNNDAEDANATLQTYTLDAGDINISRDPSSLSNQEYAPGSNDVVFLTARVVVDQPIIVDGIRVDVETVTNGATTTNHDVTTVVGLNASFDNFRLYVNDKLIDTENEFVDAAKDYLNFQTTFELAGTSVIKLVGNIESAADNGDTIKMAINNDAFSSPEYISTGDQIVATDVLGSAIASFVEVQQSILEIARTDGFSAQTVVAGVDDITIMKFILDSNDSGDVNVTSITIDADGNGSAAAFGNFTAAIFVDGVQQGSSRNFNTTGGATFNDLSVVIASAGQKEFELVVDTLEAASNSTPAGTTMVANKGVATIATTWTYGTGATCAVVGDAPNAVTTAIPAGATCIGVPGTGLTGMTGLAISTDGTATGSNAEIDNTVVTTQAGGVDYILLSAALTNSHLIGEILGQTAPAVVYYADGDGNTANPIFVSSVTGFSNGDTVTFANVTVFDQTGAGSTTDLQQYVVANISTANNTFEITPTLLSAATTELNTGATASLVVNAVASDQVVFSVEAVNADNVENGNEVSVVLASDNTIPLSDNTQSDLNNAGDNTGLNSSGVTTVVAGGSDIDSVVYTLVEAGTLTVANGATITNSTNIIVANATEIEVYKIRLTASNDDVEVKDFYFINDLVATSSPATRATITAAEIAGGDRFNFKLYDEAGNLVQTKQMIGGRLHFELANANRIQVPKDNSTVLTLKVDARDITEATQTAQQIDIAFDTAATGSTNGLEAVTSSTGADLTVVTNGATSSEAYVAYRTMLTFANASAQPTFTSAVGSDSAVFRFTAANDAAYEALLNEVTVRLSSSGVAVGSGNATLVKYSSSAYTGTPTVIATTGAIALVADLSVDIAFTGFAEEVDGVNYYEVRVALGYDNTVSDNDSIVGTILTDTTAASNATVVGLGAQNMVWSDRSNNGAAGNYINGFEIIVPSQSAGAQE